MQVNIEKGDTIISDDHLVTGKVTNVGSIRFGKRWLPAYVIVTPRGKQEVVLADQAQLLAKH